MEFRDIKDVLTFAAFRPEPDNAKETWPKRFPAQKTLLININRASVTWRSVDKKGHLDVQGIQEGEFMDVAAQMADEWRGMTDDGWVSVSVNNRFIISLEHNLSRKKGWDDTIRSNPKSMLGTKYDRNKRYALHHNADTSASLLLAVDDSMVRTYEDTLRNHNLKAGRISSGLFAMTSKLMTDISNDSMLGSGQDFIGISWCDGSICVLRQTNAQWQEMRCRSGLPLGDAAAINQILAPFLEGADASTRVYFIGEEVDNSFTRDFLPQFESLHVSDLTQPDHLWQVLARH